MDSKYKVILTAKAREDLREVYDYISKSLMAEKAANNLVNKIQENILSLEDMPEMYSIVDINKDREQQKYRKMVINNYVAIYRVDKENRLVYIVRIVYGGRNYLNEI